jgi:acetaldehyde dehydrogenase (acetylating)
MWKEKSQASSSFSPAELVASFEKKESAPAASCQSGCEDNDKLAALVKEIVLAMKGQ